VRRSDIGPYQLLRPVKSGGEGSVFVARDRRLGRRVALKLRPLTREPAARRAALEEARLLAEFNHQQIVRLYDVLEKPDTLVLVMEYVPGHDLEEVLAVTGFGEGAVVRIALDLCSALAVAHGHDVVHADLKPSNVLLADDGRVKLTDFGIGLRGAASRTGAGTAAALAPESVCGGRCDARSDLFALGCLLYRLLSRRHPFEGGYYSPGSKPVPLAVPGVPVPETLERFIFSLLAEDPDDRPSSALEARLALLGIARDFPIGDVGELARLSDRLDPPAASGLETPVGVLDTAPARASHRPWIWFLAACGVAAALTFDRWLPGSDVRVRVGSVTVRGLAPVGEARLAEMMRQVVLARPEVIAAAPGAEDAVLTHHVNCNRYMCSSQLVREGAAEQRSDTRNLLPDDPEHVWRHRIDQGVRELFAEGP
jgi:hypothetical protein